MDTRFFEKLPNYAVFVFTKIGLVSPFKHFLAIVYSFGFPPPRPLEKFALYNSF